MHRNIELKIIIEKTWKHIWHHKIHMYFKKYRKQFFLNSIASLWTTFSLTPSVHFITSLVRPFTPSASFRHYYIIFCLGNPNVKIQWSVQLNVCTTFRMIMLPGPYRRLESMFWLNPDQICNANCFRQTWGPAESGKLVQPFSKRYDRVRIGCNP